MPRFAGLVMMCVCAAWLRGEDKLLLPQRPALSATQIVFSYAGDLWSVPRGGGKAERLTTAVGVETDPVFSPDGNTIAFTGEYDGNVDVYVMPASGGVPKRLTWHPGNDEAVGWTVDGKNILFRSPRNNPTDGDRLFTMPATGGFPVELPLPIAEEGSYSPDGRSLAYVPLFQWEAAWKRYHGGQTKKIWIAKLEDSSVSPIPRVNSNDFNPMWIGDDIYFLSDRNGPVTLFVYSTKTKNVRQVVANHGFDFKSASAGPGAIVYEQFGSLHLYDLKKGKTSDVQIELTGDFPEARPHFEKVGTKLQDAALSPTGARAAFAARGDILTVPGEKGDPRNLTNTVAVHERGPQWSPDGQKVAYFSDESGEWAIHIEPQNGLGAVTKIVPGKPAYYDSIRWSPDGKKIAYVDNHLGLWYMALDNKTPVHVDTDYYRNGDMVPSWSPDSKWLAYSKQLPSYMSAIHLYSLAGAKSTQITDGMSQATNPVFDKNGKYLYFMASTDSGMSMQPDIHSEAAPVTRSLYVVVLSKDEASPLRPESDEEKPKEEKKPEAKNGNDAEKKDVKDTRIDLDGIGQRVLALPVDARRYIDLLPGKAEEVYFVEASEALREGPPAFTVHRFDVSKRKGDVPVTGVRSFTVSDDGKKLLYQKGEQWFLVEAKPIPEHPGAAPPAGPPGEPLKTQDIEVKVDPRAEWREMYHEVWRNEQQFFYDPNLHGLDAAATSKLYEPYLDAVASRQDLNYLFTEMLGEMTVGHMFIAGGDMPDVKRVPVGMLGADYKIENNRYRFDRVYDGENWNPDLKAPLTQPGVHVTAGDYLLAVNGRDLTAAENIYSYFEGTAGKETVLRVGPDASGANSREVTVVPVPSEARLRNRAWIEDNRRLVDKLTNGRVAYVYMPDTARGGYLSFNRYFFAQVNKQALIVDERFNHGGALATDIIEYLKRQVLSLVTYRDGADMVQPQGAIFGPKVMIINEFAGSGGDAMPWYFRRAGVGKLIGERTWGGLVGIFTVPQLMDGGYVTAPNAAVWNPDGRYDVENHGVPPDIEVPLDPAAMRKGHDPQLEKAVEVVMEELKKSPPPVYKRPPYPNYHAK